jgi:hypothetical protein
VSHFPFPRDDDATNTARLSNERFKTLVMKQAQLSVSERLSPFLSFFLSFLPRTACLSTCVLVVIVECTGSLSCHSPNSFCRLSLTTCACSQTAGYGAGQGGGWCRPGHRRGTTASHLSLLRCGASMKVVPMCFAFRIVLRNTHCILVQCVHHVLCCFLPALRTVCVPLAHYADSFSSPLCFVTSHLWPKRTLSATPRR